MSKQVGHQYAKDLSLGDARRAVDHIISVIHEFVSSIEQALPGRGYGELASTLETLNESVQKCSGRFLSNDTVDWYINQLLETFTRMNPHIEQNLKDFFEAHKEIANFLDKNPGILEYKLLDFQDSTIYKMKENAGDSNLILSTLKQKNYNDKIALRGLFSTFSSMVETSEKAFLEEFITYRDKINQHARNRNMQYQFPFDPVKVFGIRGIVRRDDNRYYTESRAIRHLLDHDHFQIVSNGKICEIHFKSPINDPSWQFQYDKKFTCEEFFNYVAEVDLFYKTATNLLFTFMLLAVLRQCFVK